MKDLLEKDYNKFCEIVKEFLGWHLAIKFEYEYSVELGKISFVGERKTPEIDSDLDAEMIQKTLEYYEQRFVEADYEDLNTDVLDYQVLSTESIICIRIELY